jgi:uncharacterized membrane protein
MDGISEAGYGVDDQQAWVETDDDGSIQVNHRLSHNHIMGISFIYPQYLWLLLLIPAILVLGMVGRGAAKPFRFWASIILRGVVLLALIFGLAGIQIRLPANTLTTVFVLDVSDSIPPDERDRGERFIRDAIAARHNGDQAAIVVFGQDALVERLPFSDQEIESLEITSIPVSVRTDIASALQLSQAILPGEGAKRVILLSDGRENLGEAINQAELAATQQIELLYVPLDSPMGDDEVLIDRLDAPSDVHQGQDIPLLAWINSSSQVGATLHVFVDGALVLSRDVNLVQGMNQVPITIDDTMGNEAARASEQTGFRRFRIQIIPDADTRLQNNEAAAFTTVHGPAHILLVESKGEEGENLSRALEAAGMQISRVAPSNLPTALTELLSYDVIVLLNVPAAQLPQEAMEVLPSYVRDLGKGLLMIGGQDAYGAGGYLRTPLEEALPVDMDVKDKDLQANLALVLAVDKSGSMGRCHCDNPDLNQTYTRTEVGQPKVDIAKEAIMRAASAIGDQDYLGVVAFDSQARWALPVEQLVDPLELEQAIGGFLADGQTNLQSGVQAAYEALEDVSARKKHIILITDGWVRQGDLTQLALEMKGKGITLSIVAAGEGSAEYLAALSDLGGGRYYPATDMMNVPDIFLKETIKSIGQYIIEERFYPLPAAPSPILRGMDVSQLPMLSGYNGTSAKNTARLDLITVRGDPLLASWQYGLGRAAAWTSDLKGQWATEWLEWDEYPRFAAQLVGWLLPAPKVEGLDAQASMKDERLVVLLDAMDEEGQPLNFLEGKANVIDPELKSVELSLEQIASGKYQAEMEVSTPGTYLVRLGVNSGDQSLGQMTLGVVVPYSPEYKVSGVDLSLLSSMAKTTGGGSIDDPQLAYEHNIPSQSFAREIWQPLLLLAIILFPLDVAVRRILFGPGEVRKTRVWLSNFVNSRHNRVVERPRVLGQLFHARERARQRQSLQGQNTSFGNISESTDPSPREVEDRSISSRDARITTPEETLNSANVDHLTRLKEAKKRAKRKG